MYRAGPSHIYARSCEIAGLLRAVTVRRSPYLYTHGVIPVPGRQPSIPLPKSRKHRSSWPMDNIVEVDHSTPGHALNDVFIELYFQTCFLELRIPTESID